MASWRSVFLALVLLSVAVAVPAAAATSDLLPPSGSISGWRLTEVPRAYHSDNLWEYINGNADLFRSYGFVDLAVGDFHPEQGEGWISVDIYDMGAPLHAFGIFNAERPEGQELAALGTQGYASEGVTAFWKGSYYVKLSLIEGGDSTLAVQLAEAAAARIPGESALPKELELLPCANRLSNSERYLKKSALGHGWLNEVVSARYLLEEAIVVLYVADLGTVERAAEGYAKLRKFHRELAWVSDYRGIWNQAFGTKDPYNGETFVARAGQFFFIGQSENGSRDSVAKLVKTGVANLPASQTGTTQ